jgi:SAM-dependent methyltransferase
VSGALRLEDVGRRAGTGEPVTVTARSLFLTRDVTVQAGTEAIYVDGAHQLPEWHADTYLGGLGLSPDLLARWIDAKAAVLDLASGLALFGVEAAALGLSVDCADAEFGPGHESFALAKPAIARSYGVELERLRSLARRGEDPRYHMSEETLNLLDRLIEHHAATVARYPEPSGRRFVDDARSLATVADDGYDAVLCGWLLVHLTEEDERRVVRAAVRVTRPGGEVRLRAGTGGSLAKRYEAWFPGGAMESKRAVVGAGSREDLLILHVARG